jgi:hypothetical protein
MSARTSFVCVHDVMAEHHRVPAEVGRAMPVRIRKRGGLAGAIGPEEPVHRALRHVEIDPVERTRLPVYLGQTS